MKHPVSHRLLAVVLATTLVGGALPGVAYAETTPADKASAKDWMREGKDLRAKGDHAGALKKFSAAYSVVPTPITGLAVAQEQVALGLLVEARDTLGEVQRMPTKATESADGKSARDEAASLLSDVMARIPIVEIRVTGVPAGGAVTLTIDGRSVPAIAAEEGWRVNPGRHTVVASLAGRPDQSTAIELKERDRKKVELVFPALVTPKPVEPEKPAEPAKPVTPPEPARDSTPPATPDTPASASSTKYIGIAALGTGVLAVGIGGILGLAARSKYNSAKSDHCSSAGICDAEGKTLTDDARGLGTAGTVVFTVGAVIAVGGAVLWLTAPDAGATKTGVTSVGVGVGSLTVGGRF